MHPSVFVELKFWLLVVFSSVAPFCIYGVLLKKRSISRASILVFGVVLMALAGIDVYLLQTLATTAKLTVSVADDRIFASELSVALYLFPILFGGVGVNIVSHVLVTHLTEAQKEFEQEHPDA